MSEPFTDAELNAVAAWFSHWMGASSIRRRDRAYAREILAVLIAAGWTPPDRRAALTTAPKETTP